MVTRVCSRILWAGHTLGVTCFEHAEEPQVYRRTDGVRADEVSFSTASEYLITVCT